MPDIEKAVREIISIANDDTHGYDQEHRYGPDYDCSSLVSNVLHNAGFDISKYSYTGNMEQQLRRCGFIDCVEPWKAGDIHLKVGKHVVMSINSTQVVTASMNENGTIKGGKTGDQTGKEIYVRNYYVYNGGWDYHLRYKQNDLEKIAMEVIKGKWGNGNERKIRLVQAGYNYNEVQKLVNQILKG